MDTKKLAKLQAGWVTICKEPSALCDWHDGERCFHGGKGCVNVLWVKPQKRR